MHVLILVKKTYLEIMHNLLIDSKKKDGLEEWLKASGKLVLKYLIRNINYLELPYNI